MSKDNYTTTETPQPALHLNVQPMQFTNGTDSNDNPTGGNVRGKGLKVDWQDGPRGTDKPGELAPSNGAFVEDVIYAAVQRLEFFQGSKFAHQNNQDAIQLLNSALGCLDQRRRERKNRGVEGKHEI